MPENSPLSPQAGAKRSGSQKRQRSKMMPVYLTPDEYTAAQTKATEAGLKLSSYGRAVILGSPGPRARRTPPLNAEALAYAVAALNKTGSNLNQVARMLNAGEAVGGKEALEALKETRAAVGRILELVGRKDRE
jgi:hypothetical protein